MNAHTLLVAATVMASVALPASAQTGASDTKDGHHYSGGPKTEVPHHMGKKEGTSSKTKSGGSHHYGGGPKTDVPHHMGPKKEQ